MKFPRININFSKAIAGILFSLLWARVMYFLWEHPSYLTFVWFYLGIGSLLLKWALFEIIDRIALRLRIKNLKKELDEADARVRLAKRRQ
jgi:hypothetical protein